MSELPLSPRRQNETPETPETPSAALASITNAEFLAAIFGALEAGERPLALGIDGAITGGTKWPAGTAWTPETATADAAKNWFFTLSTYQPRDGNYRRKKDQFARAFGVYLDDVGTKAAPRERLDACPPSYLIETSPGNHHAGYLFDQPCSDLARVEALQEALVKAGLCDPGAKGPSARVGRLPCAINGKYDPPHHCKLIEWHPTRRYSIEAMIARLELEPVAPAGTRRKTKTKRVSDHAEGDVYRPRATENAVITALRQRGRYKIPLGNGAHDVTCPWVHEHTDHLDHGTAYFEPSDLYPVGGFKCQHSHGGEKRVGSLLEFLGLSFTEAKHKPTIRVQPGELHRVVDAAERELAAGGSHYQRGGMIVNVLTDPGTGATAIKATSANALMRSLSALATWERLDARSECDVVTDPPTKHVTVLFDADGYQHLPVLRGIARQPYLRPDGSLMCQDGFDAATGIFGVFDERAFKVPTKPDKEAALAALGALRELLTEFGFASESDEAAALSLILTAAIRPSLTLAPMGHIKAPQIPSGKSYLAGLIAAFAGPSKPSAYAFPTKEDECAKLLLSALLESTAVIVFDNLTSDLIPFKSLCSVLTEEFFTDRLLGVSKIVTVPTATLFLSSGNNVDAVRDMARRVVTVNLDPACETPAARTFKADPVGAVQRERGKYVALALTIVRAYIVAGYPPQDIKALGSYSQWSRLARAPLLWLGMKDPAASVYASMAEDPDRETLGRLLTAWRAAFGDTPTPVRDVIDRAEKFVIGSAAELGEAVRDIAEERGVINRKRFGRWVARHQGRLVAGQKFVRGTKRDGAEQWRVVTQAMPQEVVSGISGVSVCPAGETVSADCGGDVSADVEVI